MTELGLRLAAVILIAPVVVLVADRWQRRRPRARTRLTHGIAVVVTPACRLCDALRLRLDELGIPHRTIAADDARLGDLSVRSAPALLRVGRSGRVEAMRTGRAALEQLDEIVGRGQRGGGLA